MTNPTSSAGAGIPIAAAGAGIVVGPAAPAAVAQNEQQRKTSKVGQDAIVAFAIIFIFFLGVAVGLGPLVSAPLFYGALSTSIIILAITILLMLNKKPASTPAVIAPAPQRAIGDTLATDIASLRERIVVLESAMQNTSAAQSDAMRSLGTAIRDLLTRLPDLLSILAPAEAVSALATRVEQMQAQLTVFITTLQDGQQPPGPQSP